MIRLLPRAACEPAVHPAGQHVEVKVEIGEAMADRRSRQLRQARRRTGYGHRGRAVAASIEGRGSDPVERRHVAGGERRFQSRGSGAGCLLCPVGGVEYPRVGVRARLHPPWAAVRFSWMSVISSARWARSRSSSDARTGTGPTPRKRSPQVTRVPGAQLGLLCPLAHRGASVRRVTSGCQASAPRDHVVDGRPASCRRVERVARMRRTAGRGG